MENILNGKTTFAAWLELKHSWPVNISVQNAKIGLFVICFGAKLDCAEAVYQKCLIIWGYIPLERLE